MIQHLQIQFIQDTIGDTTLQSIIDNDHAIYYGGSSSSNDRSTVISFQEKILQDPYINR